MIDEDNRKAVARIIDPDPDVWGLRSEDGADVGIQKWAARRRAAALAEADALIRERNPRT
jgi:hypothetical protein